MSEKIKIDPYGFREYDARWLYEKDINQEGIANLGRGLGTQIKIHTKTKAEFIIGKQNFENLFRFFLQSFVRDIFLYN